MKNNVTLTTMRIDMIRDALCGMYGEDRRLDCIPLTQLCETGLVTAALRIINPKSAPAKDRIQGLAKRWTIGQLFRFIDAVQADNIPLAYLDTLFQRRPFDFAGGESC